MADNPAGDARRGRGVKLIVAGPTGTVEHDGGTFHPEQQARMFSVMDGIRALGLEAEVICPPTPKAELDDLARVHSIAYLTELEAFCAKGGGDIDPDTFARPDSWNAARRAAGAGLAAIASLEEQGEGVAFVPVRPGITPNVIGEWGSASSTTWRSQRHH